MLNCGADRFTKPVRSKNHHISNIKWEGTLQQTIFVLVAPIRFKCVKKTPNFIP